MAERYTWSVNTTKLLISYYESHAMLYNPKHNDYKNRNKRLEIYKIIAEAISGIQEGCTANDVRKKVNGLRSQYLAEKMKVLNSKKSGQDANNLYTPTAYWYPLLSFLESSTTADESVSNIDNLAAETQSTSFEELEASQQEERNPRPTSADASFIMGSPPPPPPPPPPSSPKPPSSSSSKKRKPSYDALLQEAANTMTQMSSIMKHTPDDSLANFGKFIVSELKDIKEASNDTMVHQTKRKIQQVIMDAWDRIDSAGVTPNVHISYTSESSPAENSLSETILIHASNEEINTQEVIGENQIFYIPHLP